jgi:hypothetical protein
MERGYALPSPGRGLAALALAGAAIGLAPAARQGTARRRRPQRRRTARRPDHHCRAGWTLSPGGAP